MSPVCAIHILGILISLLFSPKGIRSLTVDINPSVTSSIGNTDVVLRCVIKSVVGEFIYVISLNAQNNTNKGYFQIASFFPSVFKRNATLVSSGQYLDNRVSLENPSGSDNVASLSFHRIQCEDDNTYKCEVTYDLMGQVDNAESISTTITITSNSTKPYFISPSIQLLGIEINDTVSFVCTGNVGKPPGRLIWRKQKHGDILAEYSNVTTDIEDIPENCTSRGTSYLTIEITEMDDGAVIECAEQSLASDPSMWIQTEKISVNYKLRNLDITKIPYMEHYTIGYLGEINLACTADGNPNPTFHWYKESDTNMSVVNGSMLFLRELTIGMSGVYICMAFQRIGDLLYYNASKSINISIVQDALGEVPNRDPLIKVDKMHIIIITASAAGSLVVIVVLTVCITCYKRHRRRTPIQIDTNETEPQTEPVKNQVTITLSSDYGTVHDAKISDSNALVKPEVSQYCEVDLTTGKPAFLGKLTNRNLLKSTDDQKVTKSTASSAIYASVNKIPSVRNKSNITQNIDKSVNKNQDSLQASQKTEHSSESRTPEAAKVSNETSEICDVPFPVVNGDQENGTVSGESLLNVPKQSNDHLVSSI